MGIFFMLFIIIHGLLHIPAFMRIYYFPIKRNAGKIVKLKALLWFLSGSLFLLTAILFYNSYKYWWILSLIAIVMSQLLIFLNWRETKLGTVVNVIILAIFIIIFCSQRNFLRKYKQDFITQNESIQIRLIPIFKNCSIRN